MNTFEAIKARRAIKHFDPNHELSKEEEKQLFELAMDSPTSYNIQHWRFVSVKDKELRGKIREASFDQAQVTDASLLIILCGDLKAWEKDPSRYWKNAPKEVQDFIIPSIGQFYGNNDQAQRDEAIRSCGIAAQTLMLTAKSMGYDSCPMVGFDPGKVGELIKLPEDHMVVMFVVVGKKTQDIWPKSGQLPMNEIVISDHF